MFFDTVIIYFFGESSGNAWQWLPYKKIPTFAQNNIALKPMMNVWISRYFSITVSVLIVDEISGEEPGLSSLITCIIAWSQNWCLNNTSWVTPSHKWSRDLETLILNNYRVLPQVNSGLHKQGIVRLTVQWSKQWGEGKNCRMAPILGGEDKPKLWCMAQIAGLKETSNQKMWMSLCTYPHVVLNHSHCWIQARTIQNHGCQDITSTLLQ